MMRRHATRVVLCARHTAATILHRNGFGLVSLGEAGALDLDVHTAISVRDALTALIAEHGARNGGRA